MSDELGIGHRLLDRLQGSDHELQKIDLPTMKKALQRAGDKRLADALEEVAVLDRNGCVDIRATAVKYARREFYKNLPADDARLNAPWADPGTSASAPRGSGPAPRPPEAQPRMGNDQGNVGVTAKPVMTSAGEVYQQGVHNPEFAMRLLQAIIDQRRAMRQRG